jgi:hypothetical protein
MLNNLKIKRKVKKETDYIGALQTLVLKDPTPDSDEAMIRYLTDSIAWLDSFDEKPVAKV